MNEGTLVPREPIPGMPDDLADAVFGLTEDDRELAVANWTAIGEDGRNAYRRYLDRAWRARSRRERCELAAGQLVAPDQGFTIPGGGF
jgi:hypothetical protein